MPRLETRDSKVPDAIPGRWERRLQWILRLVGAMMALAFVPVFFPMPLMAWVHDHLGVGAMPDGPVFEYLARSCSLLYGMHGTLVLVLSSNPRRYRVPIVWVIGLHLLCGTVLLGVDLVTGLPWYWTLFEGPGIVAMAGLMAWLWLRAGTEFKAA